MAAESSSSAEAALASAERPAAWNTPATLVKRYFHQLTQGCGRKQCPNRNCLDCPDGRGALDPTAAAVLSLQLAQGEVHYICDDGPPFLHIELVRDLVAAADTKRLVKELAAVFSNSVLGSWNLRCARIFLHVTKPADFAFVLRRRMRLTRASCSQMRRCTS